MDKSKRIKSQIVTVLLLSFIFTSYILPQGSITEHLNYLAHKITTEAQPPATLSELEAKRPELRKKFFEIIGLNPMPEKTPLNIQFVGEKVDLGNCYFQRVVFESRPKSYVAAHLYIPKNVTFPVPAVIHVPGHGMRDKYRLHPRTYAENGFVAIGLPMVGEEGRRGAGWQKDGEKGPYVGHFNWYNTGYGAVAPTVWGDIRTVDFLLTLTDDNGVKLVDENKIGMAGLSGGSARTLWTTIAEPRISCAVVNEGFTTIDKYNSPRGLENTCDIHIFYNYFGLSYAELYSLIAPRPLLVQHGTQDNLYPNFQPVIDYLKKIYKLYKKEDNFKTTLFEQGHGYSDNIWNTENDWMDKWLRNGNSPLTLYDRFDATLTCFPNGEEPTDMVHEEELYTPATPEWKISTELEFNTFKDSLMKQMHAKIIRTAFLDSDAKLKTVSREDHSGYSVEEKNLTLDEETISHKGYFFYKPGEKRKTVILISQSTVNKTSLTTLYEDSYFKKNVNLFCLEITGTARRNRWLSSNHFTYDRFAQLVGHTQASLQINDILAAVKTIKQNENVDTNGVYLWGKNGLSVPVLYSAVADSTVAGVILENAQDRHIGITPVMASKCSTAVFSILKYADIPQVAGLLYPRKIVLAGTVKEGFQWTEKLYEDLGASDSLSKGAILINDILEKITNTSTSVGYGKVDGMVPDRYSLSNYPNPFNPTTTIVIDIPKAGNIELKVYNSLGKKITTLVDKELSSGSYRYEFGGNNLASGVYFCKLSSEYFTQTNKMILLK